MQHGEEFFLFHKCTHGDFFFVSQTNAGRPHGENSEMGTEQVEGRNWKRSIIYGPWAGAIQVLGSRSKSLGTHSFLVCLQISGSENVTRHSRAKNALQANDVFLLNVYKELLDVAFPDPRHWMEISITRIVKKKT